MSHSKPSSSEPVEIKITRSTLSEIQGKIREHGPVQAAIVVLEKLLGDKIAAAKANPHLVKEHGARIFPTLATSLGDSYFLERVLCKAVETVSHIGTDANFRLSFPHIDNLISG